MGKQKAEILAGGCAGKIVIQEKWQSVAATGSYRQLQATVPGRGGLFDEAASYAADCRRFLWQAAGKRGKRNLEKNMRLKCGLSVAACVLVRAGFRQ